MSYDIHITKADHWVNSAKNPITPEDMEKAAELLHTHKEIPFLYQQGRLTVGHADEGVIRLMIQIADRLNARVQGDDGEYYSNDEKPFPLPQSYMKNNLDKSDIEVLDDKKTFIEPLGVNDVIQHPKYGVGKIIEVRGSGSEKELVVRFSEGNRDRRLLAYHAPIQPVHNNG